MTEFITNRIVPLIKSMENFLTHEECQILIENARDNLKKSTVIGHAGHSVVMEDHRDSSSARLNNDSPIVEKIHNKISALIGIDKSRFETVEVICYKVGQEFKRHPDYFYGAGAAKASEKGGNRIATAIIYLNDVEEGGDTDFPWLRFWTPAKEGKLLYFEYDYSDPLIIRTAEHCGKPIIKGEKWIAALWVRKYPRTTLFSDFSKFVDNGPLMYPPLMETNFELEVGPENDRRLLKIELPPNESPENTIIIGFTGGMDCSLLLYILAGLNSQQAIPYFIKPVMITSNRGSRNGLSLSDSFENAELMLSLIRGKTNGNIVGLSGHPGLPQLYPFRQIMPGLIEFFHLRDGIRKYTNNISLFLGTNEVPGKDSGIPEGPCRPTTFPDYMRMPLLHLKKYHIVDAIMQLGLEDIFEHTAKCEKKHTSLLDPCYNWPCMERRWAFTMINKEEIGSKYFLNNGEI